MAKYGDYKENFGYVFNDFEDWIYSIRGGVDDGLSNIEIINNTKQYSNAFDIPDNFVEEYIEKYKLKKDMEKFNI